MAQRVVAMIGTLDTKGPEFEYLGHELRRCGLDTLVVDISCLKVCEDARPAYACVEVARRAAWKFEDVTRLDKRRAGEVMVAGATAILQELQAAGKIDGLIALGGANGTWMSCEIMKAFPIGFPTVVVSVVAACDPRQNVGTKDIFLVNSVTDMCLNQVTRQIISNAAAAIAGMLDRARPILESTQKLQVGATMLGLTQGCVLGASAAVEAEGGEVLVFHTNGIGGTAFEDMVSRGIVDAVLDLTTNELGNNLLGGVFDAGPHRLEAAGRQAIPQVIAPGAVDFVNFWGRWVPERFRDRQFIFHNVQNTLMRTTPEENLRLGCLFADKLNRSQAPVVLVVPLHGFSGNDRAGGAEAVTIEGKPAGAWHHPQADRAFLAGLKSAANPAVIDIWEVEAHINDRTFSEAVIGALHSVTPTTTRRRTCAS